MNVENYFYHWLSDPCSDLRSKTNLSLQEQLHQAWGLSDVQDVNLTAARDSGKSALKSVEFRNQGNDAYKQGDYCAALSLYSQAILHAPHNSGSDSERESLPLAYGNRSLVLLKTGCYGLCLRDIDLAVQYGYPPEKLSKLHERSAACYVALGDRSNAATEYRSAMEICDSDEVLDEIRKKLASLDLKSTQSSPQPTGDEQPPWKPVPNVTGESDSSRLSNAVALEYSDARGRHYVATRDIEPGEVILVEEPYAYLLRKENNATHCAACMRRCVAPLPCRSCATYVFCSEKCENEAWQSFHKHECALIPYIDRLWKFVLQLGGALDVGGFSDKERTRFIFPLRMILKAGVKILHEQFLLDSGKATVDQKTTATDFDFNSFHSINNPMLSEANEEGVKFGLREAVLMLKLLRTKTTFFDEFGELDGGEKPITATEISNFARLKRCVGASLSKNNIGACSMTGSLFSENGTGVDKVREGEMPTRAGNAPLKLESETVSAGESEMPSEGGGGTEPPSRLTAQQQKEFEVYVGATLVRMFLIAGRNVVAMSERELIPLPEAKGKVTTRAVPSEMGMGVYVKSSLFNHSCYANVASCYHGTTLVVRSIRSVTKGEELVTSYASQYDHERIETRAMQLRTRFNFDCSCQACMDKWPLVPPLRIRCPFCGANTSFDENSCQRCGNARAKVTKRWAMKRRTRFKRRSMSTTAPESLPTT